MKFLALIIEAGHDKIKTKEKFMHIIWKGQSCFNLLVSPNKGEQISLVIDPYDTSTETKISRVKSDIILSTQITEKENLVTGSDELVHVIDGPGEYEIKEIYIKGIACPASLSKNKEGNANTLFTVEAEGMNICHLGLLNQKELTPSQLEEMGDVDILLIPVGDGGYTVDGNDAAAIVTQVEPKIVIPMFYHLPDYKLKIDGPEKFLKAIGETPEKQDKLLIKQKDLPDDNIKVVVLTP